MKNTIAAVIVLSSSVLLNACAVNSPGYGTTYVETDPGYTGYTVGDGAYNISNGYGPEFWNPGFNNNNYVGYSRAYIGHGGYYGGYYGGHGGYYGGHGGYYSGRGGYRR